MRIDIQNLCRKFADTRAVDDVSFQFGSGQVVGFVGPNGAGKTTTMRIMATLDEATGGDVLFDGVSVTQYPEQARAVMGFVPDALPEHSDITVHEYLDFFARAYGLRGLRRRAAVEAVEEFTTLTGMRDKLLKTLSKGMKQRVSLARALVHDPEVLILDEPAAGLDPRARVELRELLHVLAERDKAILISSHILTELTEICNAVAIIEKGRLLDWGGIEEVAGRSRRCFTVCLRALQQPEALLRALLEHPHVEQARQAGRELVAEIDGGEPVAAALLAELVGQGHAIVEFRPKRAGLEEVFMNLTKGDLN